MDHNHEINWLPKSTKKAHKLLLSFRQPPRSISKKVIMSSESDLSKCILCELVPHKHLRIIFKIFICSSLREERNCHKWLIEKAISCMVIQQYYKAPKRLLYWVVVCLSNTTPSFLDITLVETIRVSRGLQLYILSLSIKAKMYLC